MVLKPDFAYVNTKTDHSGLIFSLRFYCFFVDFCRHLVKINKYCIF